MELCCGHCNGALAVLDEQMGMRLRCPHCGVMFIVTGDKFLFSCPGCASVYEDDLNFCGKCGTPMNSYAASVGGSHAKSEKQDPFYVAWKLFAIVMAVFLAGAWLQAAVKEVKNAGKPSPAESYLMNFEK